MHSLDRDEFFLEIVVGGEATVDDDGFRLQYLKDFEPIVPFHRDNDAIVPHAELRCRFRAIVGDKDFLRRRLTADFSFLSCNELAC